MITLPGDNVFSEPDAQAREPGSAGLLVLTGYTQRLPAASMFAREFQFLLTRKRNGCLNPGYFAALRYGVSFDWIEFSHFG
jgi:hypothetical protein